MEKKYLVIFTTGIRDLCDWRHKIELEQCWGERIFRKALSVPPPAPSAVSLGKLLLQGFPLVILENRLTCSPISCFPSKLSPVPAINSPAKPQQPYFFLHTLLFWWLSGHNDLSIRIFFILKAWYNSIPKKSVALAPKYPLTARGSSGYLCKKKNSCVINCTAESCSLRTEGKLFIFQRICRVRHSLKFPIVTYTKLVWC